MRGSGSAEPEPEPAIGVSEPEPAIVDPDATIGLSSTFSFFLQPETRPSATTSNATCFIRGTINEAVLNGRMAEIIRAPRGTQLTLQGLGAGGRAAHAA